MNKKEKKEKDDKHSCAICGEEGMDDRSFSKHLYKEHKEFYPK